MSKTYEEWLKYYENYKKEQVIFDMMLDMQEIERLNNIINELEKELFGMYVDIAGWSEDYAKKRIKELEGESNEKN